MPRLDNFRKYRYTADLWLKSDAGGTTTAGYSFVRQVRFDVSQGTFGRLTVVFSDADNDLVVGARLHNLSDGGGNEIATGGVWNLTEVLPIVNVFGRREGFRANASMNLLTGEAVS